MVVRLDGERLYLSGFVGDDLWGDGMTYVQVVTALARAGEAPLVVHLNSGGGYAYEGAAIHALLAARAAPVDVVVDGAAHSAASVVALGGRSLRMAEGATLMIHEPAGVTFGGRLAHEQSLREIEAFTSAYAAIYARASGLTVEECVEMMAAETWMTADEAVARGFASGKVDGARAVEAAPFAYAVYARAPELLRDLARARGWTAPVRSSRSPAAPAAPTARTEVLMSEQTKAGTPAADAPKAPTAADIEAARVEAARVAVKADRDRRLAVTAAEEARGREALAEHLLTSTDHGVEAILATLGTAPAAAGEPQGFAAASLATAGISGRGAAAASGSAKGDRSALHAAVDRVNARRR